MGQPARKLTAKDANAKLAHRRLTVLELAERLGNVAEACRRGGIDRTSFYDWKRRFQLEGLDGLKDLPPIAKSHPMTTPPEVVARIAALALKHPAYGCNRLEALLALEGRRLSAITIQKILNDKGDAAARDAAFDALLQQIGTALEADPILGGLAFGLTYGRPEPAIEAVAGAPAIKSATLTVAVDYESDAPLA